MTETELLKIISSLGLSPEDILKPKHGQTVAITAHKFIEAVMATDSIPEAAVVLGVGYQTLNRLITKHFVPLFGQLNGGNETWKLRFLSNAELKTCSICKNTLPHHLFTKYQKSFDGLDVMCRGCKSSKNSFFYEDNKDRYHKEYIRTHRSEYNARNALRRAQKLQATPTWADLAKIKKIYEECPDGCHVDHIYPLISDWVCGLHVETNLQHLSAEENMRKGNRQIAGLV